MTRRPDGIERGIQIDPDAMPPEELSRLREQGYGHLIGKSRAEREAEIEDGGTVPSSWYLDVRLRADRYAEALAFIRKAASVWHGDDAAKGRALDVIARRAEEALDGIE
jgi:hypothetical protein